MTSNIKEDDGNQHQIYSFVVDHTCLHTTNTSYFDSLVCYNPLADGWREEAVSLRRYLYCYPVAVLCGLLVES